MSYKIYLDVCCRNRPFDDWAQERIRLEGDSILSIMERIRAGQWQLIASEAIAVELEKMRNLEKKEQILYSNPKQVVENKKFVLFYWPQPVWDCYSTSRCYALFATDGMGARRLFSFGSIWCERIKPKIER